MRTTQKAHTLEEARANHDARRIERVLKHHVSHGMKLVEVRPVDGKQVVTLKSERRYDGEFFEWRVPVDTDEVAKGARRVARMISEEAAEDLRRSFPEK